MGGASPSDRPEPRLASQGLAWSRAPAPPAGGAERGQGDPGRRRQPLQGPRGWLKAKSLVAVGTHRIRTGERLPKKWQQRGLTNLLLRSCAQMTPPRGLRVARLPKWPRWLPVRQQGPHHAGPQRATEPSSVPAPAPRWEARPQPRPGAEDPPRVARGQRSVPALTCRLRFGE